MFISIHIPKTAGTTLAYIFDYGSGRRIMYDYKADYSNAVMDDLDFWRLHKPFIERQFDFVHGHFFYRKYAELFPDADYLVCLRHPVERIISQFNHVMNEANPDDWQYRAIVDNGLDLVDYATFDGVPDAQARHVEGRAIEDYEFVFLTETLSLSMLAFEARYGFGRQDPYWTPSGAARTVPVMNARTEKVSVTQAQREKVYEVAAEDVEVYRRGTDRAQALIRAAGLG